MIAVVAVTHGQEFYRRVFPTREEAVRDAIRLIDRLWDDAYDRAGEDREARLKADGDYLPAHTEIGFASSTSCECGHLRVALGEAS